MRWPRIVSVESIVLWTLRAFLTYASVAQCRQLHTSGPELPSIPVAQTRRTARSEDCATAQAASSRQETAVWRNIASAAESGWDFSSRWLPPGGALQDIRTTAIVPVDLNTFLWKCESMLAQLCLHTGDTIGSDEVGESFCVAARGLASICV